MVHPDSQHKDPHLLVGLLCVDPKAPESDFVFHVEHRNLRKSSEGLGQKIGLEAIIAAPLGNLSGAAEVADNAR